MTRPLFSVEEDADFKMTIGDLEGKYRQKEIDFSSYWSQKEAIEAAHQVELARRVRARAWEYLNGLLIMVGERGSMYVNLMTLFSESDLASFKQLVAKHDIPEVRRTLYTMLKALTEIPRSWAMSAFARFLRGTGKQAGSKYHGAGALGVAYGWKEDEVLFFSRVLTDGQNPYSKVLVRYDDTLKESEEDLYEVMDDKQRHSATTVVRDVEFLNQLCFMLEGRGLAPVPAPAPKKPKKDRVAKVFKSGDVIRQKDLRDLPLPAHVRIAVERLDETSKQWLDDTIEHVVVELVSGGYYLHRFVVPQENKSYLDEFRTHGCPKKDLDSAVYLGPWTGEDVKKGKLSCKFRYRVKSTS